ncbi:hypothetical protein [Streptacidiphilus rugosus]|uniref:hypothetical protein n=1 Tax=Streptacidiphilus rugosus TaxID=405783 RepID=UPI00055A57E4|nr:hypothetical protein [Streptacidiphilus rugosus]
MSPRTLHRTARLGTFALLLAAGLATTTACSPHPTSGASASQASTPVASASQPASTAPTTTGRASDHFSAGGVDVTLTVSSWDGKQGVLTVAFKPQRATYHLYSVTLPADGVDGVGRPTSATVTGAVKSTGKLTTSAPLHQLTIPGVAKPLPVYPDGPLTTTIPIRATGGQGTATIAVSYAACSETYGCNLPVDGHKVNFSLKAGEIVFPA